MTRRLFPIYTALLLLSLATGCKKEDSGTSSDQFTDNLKLGTGMSASTFTLTGEGSTFTATPNTMIYWRLESKDDMAGSAVTIKIEKNTGGTYTTSASFPFANPQSYGHIMMSAFPWNQTGSYRATGILTATNKTVATKDFTVN
jgi:hypothetical protein